MPRDLHKGHAALRRGRVSIPGAEYFLTVCTADRRPGLTAPAAASGILAEAKAMEADATWRLRSAVVMPDHVHLQIVLGERLPLGKAIARLKSKTSALLSSAEEDAAIEWERDFYDHRVRPENDRLAIFLYLLLNPHRAHLCRRGERWPWYFCGEEDWAWFKDLLDEARPLPEWLA